MSLHQESSTAFDQQAVLDQASQELDVHLVEEFGTTNIGVALAVMAAKPQDYADGRWGLSHGGLTALYLTDPTNPVLSEVIPAGALVSIDSLIAYWYVREALARCGDDIAEWRNPLNWSEDSRLDYMTPVIFMDWVNANV